MAASVRLAGPLSRYCREAIELVFLWTGFVPWVTDLRSRGAKDGRKSSSYDASAGNC